MKQYHQLLQDILDHGDRKEDRTGTGTISLFGYQMRFNLNDGFPLVTTKKIHMKSVIHELLWMISGDTNIKYLQDNGVRIWNEWADENGDLGPVYGKQWRDWNDPEAELEGLPGIDQLENAINLLKTNPDSRRIIVSAWNPAVLPNTSISFAENVSRGRAALPPCHAFFQFHSIERDKADIMMDLAESMVAVAMTPPHPIDDQKLQQLIKEFNIPTRKLSCQMYQRSADVFLGVPFNIASYALLTMMIAQVTNHALGDFVHTFGDVHIYLNHLDAVKLQLSRDIRHLPQIRLNPEIKTIEAFTYDDIELINYDPHPLIKGQVSV